MCLVKLGTIFALGEVVSIRNLNGKAWITLDYYGKKNDYTTVEIEGML